MRNFHLYPGATKSGAAFRPVVRHAAEGGHLRGAVYMKATYATRELAAAVAGIIANTIATRHAGRAHITVRLPGFMLPEQSRDDIGAEARAAWKRVTDGLGI